MSSRATVSAEEVVWQHADGSMVRGRRRAGVGGTVVFAGATAVPARYYDALAAWLSEETGCTTVTFDYRGVGASRPDDLASCGVDLRGWAADLQTVVAAEAERGPVVVVGHSFGGHAFGMTDGWRHTRGLYTFATGSGWHGWMTPAESWRVRALWHLLGPPLVAWHGYLPMASLGMGEDLPRAVYKDWKRWCGYPDYFFGDPTAEFAPGFAAIDVPVVGVNATDDPWSAPVSAETFLSHYPQATLRTVTPDELGLGHIGHMAYVRPRCRALWADLAGFVRARLGEVDEGAWRARSEGVSATT